MKIVIMIALMNLASNCTKESILQPDELSIKRSAYMGNELRINGYYYQKYGNPERLTIYIYYKNGVLLHTGDNFEYDKLNEFETIIQSKDFIEKLKGIKTAWGVFKIESNTIAFERWYPSDPPLKAYIRSGVVLNDSTFQVTKSMRSDGSEVKERSEIYHFKAFSPKPDSTNSFIK